MFARLSPHLPLYPLCLLMHSVSGYKDNENGCLPCHCQTVQRRRSSALFLLLFLLLPLSLVIISLHSLIYKPLSEIRFWQSV